MPDSGPVISQSKTAASVRTEKRQKFVKLAEGRTKTAIKAIRTIAKLGNKNAYEFSDVDVNKIAKALAREIDAMKARMSHSSAKEEVDFEL